MSAPENTHSSGRAAVVRNLEGLMRDHGDEWVWLVDALHMLRLMINGTISRRPPEAPESLLLDLRTCEQYLVQMSERATADMLAVRQLVEALSAKAPEHPGEVH